jgi:hypothetical protein
MANKRTRTDKIVSFTTPHNTRLLLDTLCGARHMSRSEYLRYLILEDARRTAASIIDAALAEDIYAKRGRLAKDEEFTESPLLKETKEQYRTLLRLYGEFVSEVDLTDYILSVEGLSLEDFAAKTENERTEIVSRARVSQREARNNEA